jgi:thioredoxin-related protein
MALFILSGVAFALEWKDNYQAALEKARAEQKYVFMLFTGSDWCPPCKALAAEILPKPEFMDFAKNNLVCLELDFPSKKKQALALRLLNETLSKFYKIEGYPTMILLRPDGSYLGTMMYRDNDVARFTERLKEIIEKDSKKSGAPALVPEKVSALPLLPE